MFIIYIKHYFPHISIKFFVLFCYWYNIWVITQLCSRACLGVTSMKILSNFFPYRVWFNEFPISCYEGIFIIWILHFHWHISTYLIGKKSVIQDIKFSCRHILYHITSMSCFSDDRFTLYFIYCIIGLMFLNLYI